MEVKDVITTRFMFDGRTSAAGEALEIVKIYAASANAQAKEIPGLFHDLVSLLTTGEVPERK